MLATLTALALFAAQDPGDPQLLVVGQTLEGRITDADPQVRTPTLDANYTDAPVIGQTFRIEVEAPGPYTLELVSHLFDAYLVLHDEAGAILAEDDDGAIGIHACITRPLDPSVVYWVEACALHGQRGPFELRLAEGRPRALSPTEERSAERTDLERTAGARERVLGPAHPDVAAALDNLGLLLHDLGNYAAAGPLLERSLSIRERALGTEHPDTSISLNDLALVLQAQGDYTGARALFERALAIREKVLRPEHPWTALSLSNLGRLLQDQGDYEAARSHLERALAIHEKTLGPEHLDTSTSLNNLARLFLSQGDHAAARPLFERALAIREKTLGPEHPWTAISLNNLGCLLEVQGDHAGARPLLERALVIDEKVLGPEHPETFKSLNNLAGVEWAQGDYAAARELLERTITIDERALGPEHPRTALSLTNLATLLEDQGEYSVARPLYERALAIREKTLGPEHPETAQSLRGLASLLFHQGDHAAARPLYERALAICESVLGPEHPETALILNNLAILAAHQGDYTNACPALERVLAINEKVFGRGHPDTARSLNNLAYLLDSQGDHEAAQELFARALAIFEQVFGPEYSWVATTLGNLAHLHAALGDHAEARRSCSRALAIREKLLGSEHPDTALTRYSMALLLADQGEASRSIELARMALESRLAHARSTLWSLSEPERLLFLGAGESCLHLVLSLSNGAAAASDGGRAYELSLAWRGIVARSMLASRERMLAGAPPEVASMKENLRGVQAQLSKLLYATEIHESEPRERQIRALRERRNELEVELQRRVGPGEEQASTLAMLRGELGESAALVDLLVHPHYEPAELDGERMVRKGAWTADSLSAWIVRSDRELVHLDLGPARAIEDAVRGWLRAVLSDSRLAAARGIGVSPGSVTTADEGKELAALLWEPLERELAGVGLVFVRSDSFLGTMPFEVISLDEGRYLIEQKRFVYLQTPTELTEAGERPAGGPVSLIVAGNVDFQSRGEVEAGEPKTERMVASALLGGTRHEGWAGLPFTGAEARAIERLHDSNFPEGERLLIEGDAATEERLKEELPRHAFVHLATHGFFNPEGTVSMWDSAREQSGGNEPVGLEREARALVGQLPGLLTGLVCAGANEPAPEGRDDGLLTAEEVLWLDLSKVELVVLSACETALGERRSGEGMIGLRRAFGLAGAKTVVSSLWSVKDRSTSELMQSFYSNLWLKKQGRGEALRNAQLEMLAKNRATEGDALPSTWGAFVLSGEWR